MEGWYEKNHPCDLRVERSIPIPKDLKKQAAACLKCLKAVEKMGSNSAVSLKVSSATPDVDFQVLENVPFVNDFTVIVTQFGPPAAPGTATTADFTLKFTSGDDNYLTTPGTPTPAGIAPKQTSVDITVTQSTAPPSITYTTANGEVGANGMVIFLPVDLKIYRPQEVENTLAWQLSRHERVIRDTEIEQKGIGIRVNKDGGDEGNENDLIEIEVNSVIPSGMSLVIKRSTNILNVYDARNAASPMFTSGAEIVVPSSSTPPCSYWAECLDSLSTDHIEFYLRPSGGQDVKIKGLS